MAPGDTIIRLYYAVKAGKIRARWYHEAPIRKNVANMFHQTSVGKFSKWISDYSHEQWCRFADWVVKKWQIYRVKREVITFLTFFGSIIIGYYYCGFAKQLYTLGHQNGFHQPFDYSLHLMNSYGGDERAKYDVQMHAFLKDALDKQGNLEALDWLMIGQHFAKHQEEEVAFQAYYLAHLLDHQKIRTNSELQQNRRQHFEQWNGQTLDEILSNAGVHHDDINKVLNRPQKKTQHRVIGRPVETRVSQMNNNPTHQSRTSLVSNSSNQQPRLAINNLQIVGTPQRSNNFVPQMRPPSNQSRLGTGHIRPPSNNQRRGLSTNIRNSGNMILQDWRSSQQNFNQRAIPISSHISVGLEENPISRITALTNGIERIELEGDRIQERMDRIDDNRIEIPSFDSSLEEEKAEPLHDNFDLNNYIDMNDLEHIQDILAPNQHFSGNLNNIRSNNRANILRMQSNLNRIEEQKQQNRNNNNRNTQQRGIGSNVPPRDNDQIIQDILNFPSRISQARGLQNLRDRLDLYDNLLEEIESFQNETETIVQNIAQIDGLLRAGESIKDVPKGLSEEGLQKQKKIVFTGKQGVGDTCSICIINFDKGEVVYELVCGHMFHSSCIEPWFKQSHVCPNCRKDLN